MKYCRISLGKLTDDEAIKGYSILGLLSLVGEKDFACELPFNRNEFIKNKPQQQKGMSISGYQPKIQLIKDGKQFNSINEKGQFILKPSPEEFANLAENEHATMAVMKALGFNVPVNGLVSFKSEPNEPLEYAFVIKRYDRTSNDELIHQESLDSAMNIADKYGKLGGGEAQFVSYESVCLFILNNTSNDIAQRIELFRRVIYAYLLGNNDLHLRNFSLLRNTDFSNTLAPIYDFVSVAPYPEYCSSYLALPLLKKEEQDDNLAHGFNTRYGQYIGQDFIEFGINIGLSQQLIEKRLFPVIQKEAQIVRDIYQRSFVSEEHQKAILGMFEQRLKLLSYVDEPEL